MPIVMRINITVSDGSTHTISVKTATDTGPGARVETARLFLIALSVV
jgi:hypothetical protein